MQGLKSAVLTIFRKSQDGQALLVRPSRIPHRDLKENVLASYESLERLKGKIGEALILKVQSGKITVSTVLKT